MERMWMIIWQEQRILLEYNERRATYTIINGVVQNFLYAPRYDDGNSNGAASQTETSVLAQETQDLASDIDEIPYIADAIKNTTASTWTTLLHNHILSQPYALVIGCPSAKLTTTMA